MLSRRSTLSSAVLVMVAMLLSLLASAAPAGAAGPAVYDSIPSPLPGSYPSLGYEATSTHGFGDDILLGSGGRRLDTVDIGMVTWAPQSDVAAVPYTNPGPWTESAGWSYPFTVKVYEVSGPTTAPVVGSVLAMDTQTKVVPWRPNHTTACPGNTWSPLGNADATQCYNGFAFNLSFDLSALSVSLPSRVAVAIFFNTQHYGPSPVTGSGPYDSLNVGAGATNPSRGADLNGDVVLWDSTYLGRPAGLTFDTAWTGNVPAIRLTTTGPTVSTTTVTAANTHGWTFFDDQGNGGTPGAYVAGPQTPPLGHGSAHFVISAANQGQALGLFPNSGGTRLAAISELTYSTYRSSVDVGNNLAVALQFNLDFDLSDSNNGFQGRFVYEPYQSNGGAIVQDTWQTWDALAGKWWVSRPTSVSPAATCVQATPCTIAQFLAAYPNAGIHADPGSGFIFKAGSGWAAFDGNVDALRVGINGVTTQYDFEDTPQCTTDCYVSPSGSDLNGGTGYADAKLTIQSGIDTVNTGGTVHVNDGIYAESPNIPKSLTLESENGAAVTTIALQTSPGYPAGSMTVAGAIVTVDGFTIKGRDGTANPGGLIATSNLYIAPAANDVTIKNNIIQVGASHPDTTTGDDGMGIVTEYAGTTTIPTLTVTNNTFQPLNASGDRAWYINPGVGSFMATGNVISGNFTRNHLTEATTALITGNTVTGPSTAGTLAIAGYSGPGTTNATFSANTVIGVRAGFSVFDANNATIQNNVVSGTVAGVTVASAGTPAVNPSGVEVHDNSFSGLTGKRVTNDFATGTVDASDNWWGNTTVAASDITGLVDFTPVQTNGTDTDLGTAGFQGSVTHLKAHAIGEQTGTEGRIQEGIDTTVTNGIVDVAPGTYSETATGRGTATDTGTYQFGIYFPFSKTGVKVQGVTAGDVVITDPTATLATVTTNATNNFGPSGIFVAGDGATIKGLLIGTNTGSTNKTIEVIADGFSFLDSYLNDDAGAIYFGDYTDPVSWRIATYHIDGNKFGTDNGVTVANGTGHNHPTDLANRTITNNEFVGAPDYWHISFRGAGGRPWYASPVGGATISGNHFGATDINIRATGMYDESEFDWAGWRGGNTFDRLVWVEDQNTGDLQTFSYGVALYTNARQLGGRIDQRSISSQPAGVQIAVSGDTIHVHSGTYPEQAILDKAGITVDGYGTTNPVVDDGASTTGTGLTILANNNTVSDLVVQRYNVGIAVPTGPIHDVKLKNVDSVDNGTHGVFVQSFDLTDFTVDGGHYSRNNQAGGSAGRGIWMINGVKTGVTIKNVEAKDNGLVGLDISDGSVTGLSITGNTVTGNGDSGIAALGATGPDANLIDGNVLTNNGRYGIEIKNADGSGAASGAGSVVVSNNTVTRTLAATDARDYAGIGVIRRSPLAPNVDQPHGVVITGNTVSGFHRKASGSTGDGFGIVVEGLDQTVTKNTVTNNDVGIQVQAGQTSNAQSTDGFDRGNAAAFSGHINNNGITANTLGLRATGLSSVADGECNWWGAISGPSSVGTGTGDEVSTDVDFLPWLVTSNLNGTCAAIAVVTPPTAALTQNEGTLFSNGGAFTDIATVITADNTTGTLVDNHDGTWSWTLAANAAANDGPASGTIVVTATASNGSTITSSFTYTINNVAPTATFVTPAFAEVGSTYQVSLINPVDVTADGSGLTYQFLCNGSAPQSVAGNVATCAAPLAPGTITAAGSITDKDTGTAAYGPTNITVVTQIGVTLTPAPFAFANTVVGQTSAPQTFTLTNNTNTAYAVDQVGFFVTLTNHFQIVSAASDQCTSSNLPIGGSCTFEVVFTPESAGSKASTLGALFTGTQPPAPKPTSALSGLGIAAPAPHATIDQASFVYPTTVVGTTGTNAFTIGNDGTADLHVTAVAISGSARFSVTGGTCSTSLPTTVLPGNSCTVTVEFAPTSGATSSGSLLVTTDGGNVSSSLSGSGQAAPVPSVGISAIPFDFGDVHVDTVAPTHTITVTNGGDPGSLLHISGASMSGSGTFTFTPVTLPVDLGTADHLDIVVTFDPTVAGVRNAILLITTNAGTQDISLTGTGTVTPPPAPIASLPAGPVAFGSVTVGDSVSTPTITLTNTGAAPLHVTAISVTGSGAFGVDDGQCASAIPVSDTCVINLTFSPTGTGAKAATLHVASDGGDPSVGLTGTGVAPTAPAASIAPTSWTFTVNPTPGSASKNFTLTNTGTAPLHVGTAVLTGSAFFGIAIPVDDACSNTTVAPAGFCVIKVTFTANVAADKHGTLSVPSDATNGSVLVDLAGTATAAPAAHAQLTPSSYNYGDVVTGQTRNKKFTLTNTGDATLSGVSVTQTGSDFSILNADGDTTCDTVGSLAPSATCTVVVQFGPSTTGHTTGTLVAHASNAADDTSDLTGSGVPPAPAGEPVAKVTPDEFSYPDQQVGDATGHTFTLKNVGDATLSTIVVSTTGSSFSIVAADSTCDDVSTLAPAAECVVKVRFEPSSEGAKSGKLKVASNATNGTVIVPLDGTGTPAPADVVVTPNPYDFGNVPYSTVRNKTFTVTNQGSSPATITGITKSGSSNFTVPPSDNECAGDTLNNGDTCTFVVRFSSPASSGVKSGTVNIDGTGFSHLQVPVTATAAPFVAKVDAYISPNQDTNADYVGRNVYCSSACNQQAVTKVTQKNKTTTYRVRVRNNGNGVDSIRVRFSQSGSKTIVKKVKILSNGNQDVTSAVTAGGYVVSDLNPGASAYFWVQVTLTSNATSGKINSAVLWGQSVRTTTVKDYVQGKTKVQ